VEGPVLFGLETEYGLTPFGPHGAVLGRARIGRGLLGAIRQGRPHLPDTTSTGFFLANGLRVSLEGGVHPEISTPECTHPSELVACTREGERLLALAARNLERTRPGSRILLSACSMDYGGLHETWGCHESYLHRSDHERLVSALVPHLVSRIVYTGAGGFHNRQTSAASAPEFLISPRACQMRPTLGGDRWFANKPQERHCVGYNRLHVVCGEPLCSDVAAWLKVGVTALIVRVLDKGVPCGEAVQLADPVDAMLAIARDPTCREPVLLADGRRRSALEIQAHYLVAVEGQLGAAFLPEWAAVVCGRWRAMLDRLRGAPDSVATTLDWAIKHALFSDGGVRRKLLERREAAARRRTSACDRTLALFPREHRRTRARARVDARAVRAELCELDVRFGELGSAGIFQQLRRAGAIDDGAAWIRREGWGIRRTPPVGRAALRAALIRRLASEAPRSVCDWEGVIDLEGARFADLKDPYETRLRWRPIEEGSAGWEAGGLIERVRLWTNLLGEPAPARLERPPESPQVEAVPDLRPR
jgi:proteasome accessory factor A